MIPKSDSPTAKMDSYKLAGAVALVLAAVFAFYYFSDVLLLIRVIVLLVALGGAVAIAITTEWGHELVGFLKESQTELRKVVWPTRAETLQTTLVVVVMVIIMGLFLWLLDVGLLWIVRSVI